MRPIAFAALFVLALAPVPALAQRPHGPSELQPLVTRLDARALARLTQLLADDALTDDQVRPHAAAIETAYARAHASGTAHPPASSHLCGSPAIPRAVRTLTAQTDVLLDLLGHLDTPTSEQALREALGIADPALRLTAVRALRRRHLAVDDAVIASLAREDTVRGDLLDEVEPEHVPEEFRTSSARARSDAVQWIAGPSRDGCVPPEVRSAGRYAIPDVGTFHVFRVRRNAADGAGVAVLAGPYDERAQRRASDSTNVVIVDEHPWGDESAMEKARELLAPMFPQIAP